MRWQRVTCMVGALVTFAALVVCGAASGTPRQSAPDRPNAGTRAVLARGPVRSRVHRAGKWLVDSQGRVVTFHGFDIVRKTAPFYPSKFAAADARFLAREGFTAARIGFIWQAAEPKPGVYDNGYISKLLRIDSLLGRYGIRTLVDMHQDLWGSSTGGDGAPAWATLGGNFDSAFAAFWRNEPARDGVGIQTLFVRLWHHIALRLKSHRNVIGIDPFNEPYAGSGYSECGIFAPCPAFEKGPLARFYRRVIHAVRTAGDHQVIWPEAIADSGDTAPALPRFSDPQTAFTFHYYCNATQNYSGSVPYGSSSPLASGCKPIEKRNLGIYTAYVHRIGVPGFLGEFSCNDVQPDNAQVVDIADAAFDSWTAWAYYGADGDPADCPGQGLLKNDRKPGGEANAVQGKLDALAVPYAEAIAGSPQSTSLDRSTRAYSLTYESHAVAGVHLRRGAVTEVFVPRRMYPQGYRIDLSGARVVGPRGQTWLALRAKPNASRVTLTIRPAA